jgi:vancomycin permeability regulator SanA
VVNEPLIVIFGAAIRPHGEPSAALLRRIGFGLAAARQYPGAMILCSGGASRPGPSEASIMFEHLVAAGLAQDRLVRDDASLTTLQNIIAAVRQVRQGGHPLVISCSDDYHLLRIGLGFAFHGVRSIRGPVPPGRGEASWRHWIIMCLRESLAIPAYLLILIVRKGRIGS